MSSQEENKETGYVVISCPRCNRNEIRIKSNKSKKNSHIYKICLSCKKEENKRHTDEIKNAVAFGKPPEQTIEDAMRQYLIHPKSIKITAAKKSATEMPNGLNKN